MANTVDVLVAPITDGVVTSVSAWAKKSLSDQVKSGILNSWLKSMLGVVSMLQANMACNAQVVVWARSASNEVLLGELCKMISTR